MTDVIAVDLQMRPMLDFVGYSAGSDGNVYSFWRHGLGGLDYAKPHRMVPQPIGNGKYLKVSLRSACGQLTNVMVHKAVCSSFHGRRPSGKECSHVNGNRFDNRPENLLWETKSQNHKRKILHGTDDCGVRNKRAKLDAQQLALVRLLLKQGCLTHEEIGRRVGVSRVFITLINLGRRYARD